MIPPIPTGAICLQPGILNRKQIREYTFLIHRHPEQLRASFAATSAQFLACSGHGLLLAVKLGLMLAA